MSTLPRGSSIEGFGIVGTNEFKPVPMIAALI
jgi:hypothetical protein